MNTIIQCTEACLHRPEPHLNKAAVNNRTRELYCGIVTLRPKCHFISILAGRGGDHQLDRPSCNPQARPCAARTICPSICSTCLFTDYCRWFARLQRSRTSPASWRERGPSSWYPSSPTARRSGPVPSNEGDRGLLVCTRISGDSRAILPL